MEAASKSSLHLGPSGAEPKKPAPRSWPTLESGGQRLGPRWRGGRRRSEASVASAARSAASALALVAACRHGRQTRQTRQTARGGNIGCRI